MTDEQTCTPPPSCNYASHSQRHICPLPEADCCCAVRTDMLTLAYCHDSYATHSLSSCSQKEISHSQWIPMSVIVSLVPVITNIEILLYAALNGSITSESKTGRDVERSGLRPIPGTVPALRTAMSKTK